MNADWKSLSVVLSIQSQLLHRSSRAQHERDQCKTTVRRMAEVLERGTQSQLATGLDQRNRDLHVSLHTCRYDAYRPY